MPGHLTTDQLHEIQVHMRAVAGQLRLPFSAKTWRGQSGNWQGAGVGSSIDFQDHRPYLPGDDPRYIDWQAYARTGHYTMKLYREEVSPLVDLVLDTSPSMVLTAAKERRTAELYHFALESAQQCASSVRVYVVRGGELKARAAQPWTTASWTEAFTSAVSSSSAVSSTTTSASTSSPRHDPVAPAFDRIPWRGGSLRVIITDLLYPGAPADLARAVSQSRGRPLFFAPFAQEEANPDWEGNMVLQECETGRRREQLISGPLMSRYGETYRRHFTLWTEALRRQAALLARVPSEVALVPALKADALPMGAVELWS